jgi:uncharacterized delta-60 repeat protein
MRPRPRLTVDPLEPREVPAAGFPDPATGANWLTTTTLPDGPRGFTAAAIAALPDGKTLLVGSGYVGRTFTPFPFPTFPPGQGSNAYDYDMVAVRLAPDGRPDPTFGTGGVAVVGFNLVPGGDDRAAAVAVRPDGRIVLAGRADAPSGSVFAAAQLTPDGRPDPAFGTGGKQTVGFAGTPASAAAVALAPDGSAVLAGTAGDLLGSTTVPLAMAVARLTPAGQPDPGFGAGGAVTVGGFGPGQFRASAAGVAVTPDGNVVLAGTAGPTSANGDGSDFAVARLTAAGGLDPSFAGDGRATVNFEPTGPGTNEATAVAVRPDGRVLVAGSAVVPGPDGERSSDFAAAQFTPAGDLDPTFGTGGMVTVGFDLVPGGRGWFADDGANALVLLPDGRAVLSGSAVSGIGVGFRAMPFPRGGAAAVALTPDGRPDPGFGADGRTVVFADIPGTASAVAVRPDGGLVLAGAQFRTAQLNFESQLDTELKTEYLVARLSGFPAPGSPITPPVPDSPSVIPTGPLPAVVRLSAPGVPAGGVPTVTVFSPDGSVRFTLDVFEPSFAGGVTVALADVTGDGIDDVIASAGDGGGPRVRVFDGATGAALADFFAFDESWRGGVNVAVGPDGEIVAGAGVGGGPRVRVFDGAGTPLADFFAFGDGFRGGVSVATADVTGDGVADVVAGAGPGGGPHVRVFDGATGAALAEFLAGDPDDRGGARVAVRGRVVVTKAAGGVRAFDLLSGTDVPADAAASAAVFVG